MEFFREGGIQGFRNRFYVRIDVDFGTSYDSDPLITTTAMEAVAPYVVCQVVFAAPTRVDLIDLVDFGVQAVAGGPEDPTPPVTYPPGFPWWKPNLPDLPEIP